MRLRKNSSRIHETFVVEKLYGIFWSSIDSIHFSAIFSVLIFLRGVKHGALDYAILFLLKAFEFSVCFEAV